jgi:DNA-binding MarR family transcriptional regulator
MIDTLREMHATDRRAMSAFLSDPRFDNITQDGAVALGAAAIGEGAAAIGDGVTDEVMQTLGIEAQAASQIIDTLVLHGYLRRRVSQADHRQMTTEITEQGYGALYSIIDYVIARRWDDFQFRQGDIVISSIPKSGTTWVQMICALMIFQSPEIPAPLSTLSPWLDHVETSRSKAFAELGAQAHRRFIKTHTPLTGFASDPRVTYIVVARHPLDVEVSKYHQEVNLGRAPAQQPREWLVDWIDRGLPRTMQQLSSNWTCRDRPNTLFVHYEDLSADLAGQMRRLAARLGITVPAATWPDLVEAATFTEMRAAADRLRPLPYLQNNTAFFHRGSSGSGRDLLSDAELARYHECAARVAPPELLAWLHRNGDPGPGQETPRGPSPC